MKNTTNRARFLLGAGAALAAGAAAEQADAAEPPPTQPSADDAIKRLLVGNRRYVTDTGINCARNYDRRIETSTGQMPFAIILSCSDSRVPAEMVFDQRVGDLFMIRVAGNIAEPAGIGSIEYAISHFHSPVLMVLGHQSCGAVEATIEVLKSGARPPGQIGTLTDAIAPAVKDLAQHGGTLDQAVRANVAHVAKQLRAESTIVADADAAHAMRIAGAYYSLADGRVTLL
jgi:carbonic anhydrase